MSPEVFFKENLQLIGDARTDPLNWNLNNGLRSLSQQNATLAQEVRRLQAQVNALERAVKELRFR